jgi:hypothetical protein
MYKSTIIQRQKNILLYFCMGAAAVVSYCQLSVAIPTARAAHRQNGILIWLQV